jgi:hypothetical protein
MANTLGLSSIKDRVIRVLHTLRRPDQALRRAPGRRRRPQPGCDEVVPGFDNDVLQ